MTLEIQKLANYLLVVALVLAPVGTSWAFQNDVADHGAHSEVSMAMDSDGAAETECCCSEDACVLKGCDPCNSVNPMVPVPDFVARILQIQAHNLSLGSNFDKLKLTPLLHPPRA